jgi:DNA-binding MarR family transcriptional regulator
METARDTLGSVGYLTNLTGRLLVRALERRLEGGFAGPMPVFLALSDGKALPQKELARLAAVEQPTMANTLARMERDGLVSGEPDPNDRRSTLLRLTPLGRARADAALPAGCRTGQRPRLQRAETGGAAGLHRHAQAHHCHARSRRVEHVVESR